MDKSCSNSSESTTTSNNSNNNTNYLRQLNKLSQKISKPTTAKKPSFTQPQPPPPPPPPATANPQQPPVYNINKNDFRELVQKLTGSPAHERTSSSSTTPANPPPAQTQQPPRPQAPQPQSSRFQRNRPPPLCQIAHRPPAPPGFPGFAPLSPLPPLPSVDSAAESPVSAYMRSFLMGTNPGFGGDPNPKEFSGFSPLAPLASPKWSSFIGSQSQQGAPPQQGIVASSGASSGVLASQPVSQLPTSPLAFGCMSSSPLLSPSALFSPSGIPQLPLSPTVPVPSPK